MAISSTGERGAIKRLVPVIRGLLDKQHIREYLDRGKRTGRERLKRRDFVWYEILLSFSTWGNSRGAKRLDFDALTYEKLSRLKQPKRSSLVRREFAAAGLRYADKKTLYLLLNFDLIHDKGGLEKAKCEVLDPTGPDAKLEALRQYKGIGEKYAHNIMMDAYHPDFHSSIAVDQRIKRISKELRLPARTYADYLSFYRKVAAEAGVQPWELDRVLYKCKADIVETLARKHKAA
jgi:hypothetical protein